MKRPADDIDRQVMLLHERTDRRFERTTAAIGRPIGCGRGCFACCVDDLTVWQVEADRIAAFVKGQQFDDPAARWSVHRAGACAFLEPSGRCQVYPARPYVCRSQGAVLRWIDRPEQGPELQRRASCSEHLEGVELSALDDGAMFDIGPAEQALATLATDAHVRQGAKGLPRRVDLRELAERLIGGVEPAAKR